MADFLEERIPWEIRMGASWTEDYSVDIVTTSGGQEYRSMPHPYPVRKFDVGYLLNTDRSYAELLGLYHRAHGKYAGFRIRCADEWSSNGRNGTPAPTDQACALVGSLTWQLRKWYGTDRPAGALGYSYRDIVKPVAGTVRFAIGGKEVTQTMLTFAISAITKAASAQLTIGTHSLATGAAVYIAGVAGMTQINNRWATITGTGATTITVDIDSSGFSTYTSGGAVKTIGKSIDATTGLVTLAPDQAYAVTAITKAAQAVVTIGAHTLADGQSLGIVGVAGMTQINGLRGTILSHNATTVTLDIDSSAFSTYTSGGTAHTSPQAGEAVTAGFEFDFPVRFNTSLPFGQDYPNHRAVAGVELIELLAP